MHIVKFRTSPSIILGITKLQVQGVVVEHIVSVGPFAKDPGRSVIVLDCQSAVQGPLTVVVDGPPDWVLDQLGLPIKDATSAPAVLEELPTRVVLPDRDGHSGMKTLDKLPT